MKTTATSFTIPAPASQPRYHEYAAGSPGDYRPIGERFADRMIEDHGLTRSPEILAALAQAFNAGGTRQAEVG